MMDGNAVDVPVVQEHIGVIGDDELELSFVHQQEIFIGIIEEPKYPAIKDKEGNL